jgi:hypothetical protein
MKINININKKFVVNGKEYNSVEEMPREVRVIFEKAKAGVSITDLVKGSFNVSTKTSVDSKTYKNVDELPPDVRIIHDEAMKGNQAKISTHSSAAPIEPKSSFSPLWLGVAILLVLLIAGLFFYLR